MDSTAASIKALARAIPILAFTALSFNCLATSEALILSVPTQSIHTSSIIPPILCAPVIAGSHHQVSCEVYSANEQAQTAPIISSPCGLPLQISSSDESFSLGYAYGGLTGYFAPARWQVSKNKGDGGVDVTGAPDGSLLVEGANNASVIATTQQEMEWQIAIPAEGFIAFDWRPIGGSNLFQVLVNGQLVLQGGSSNSSSSFFSSLLHTGDRLTLKLAAKEGEQAQIKLENFKLLTNAIGVVARHWTAADALGNTSSFLQLIAIERSSVAQVVFPADYTLSYEQLMLAASYPQPTFTGFPVLDTDGDPATVSDQTPIDQCQCGYSVAYEDEVSTQGVDCLVIRQWYITDRFSGNSMAQRQMIRVSNGLPGCQPDNKQSGAPEPHEQRPASINMQSSLSAWK